MSQNFAKNWLPDLAKQHTEKKKIRVGRIHKIGGYYNKFKTFFAPTTAFESSLLFATLQLNVTNLFVVKM